MFKHLWKAFFTSFILLLIHTVSWGTTREGIYVKDYSFPLKQTFQSTISMALVHPSIFIPGKEVREITMHPERRSPDIYGENNGAKVTWLPGASNDSPVVFIIPGLGSTSESNASLYLGEQFFQKGYGVLIFPSTISSEFSIAVSSTGLPGYSPQDAKDMYELMKKVYREVKKEDQLNPQELDILGYSMGAIDSTYVVNEDFNQKYFNFKKVLLLNPPIQIADGIQTLDSLLIPGNNYSNEEKEDLIDSAKYKIINFMLNPFFSAENLVDTILDSDFTENQISWLVGNAYRESLKKIILVSQEIHDLGILGSNNISERNQKASHFTFNDYQHLFLERYYEDKNIESFVKNSNIIQEIKKWNKQNIKWAIFHNQNDFLWRSELGRFLEDNSKQSRVYPVGGHLGNIWANQNQNDIKKFFND